MTRRRFAFWVGMGLFWLSCKLGADELDATAASLMEWSNPEPSHADPSSIESSSIDSSSQTILERWRPNANRKWRWFERQSRLNGAWERTGVTTPVDSETGVRYQGDASYLDEEIVPEDVRRSTKVLYKKLALGKPDETRRAGHGRPPSQWLRSLEAVELKLWLRTIDVPEAGVEGMTFWTHLTRDHSFSPQRIEGLTIAEQAKLHAAAHYGY